MMRIYEDDSFNYLKQEGRKHEYQTSERTDYGKRQVHIKRVVDVQYMWV